MRYADFEIPGAMACIFCRHAEPYPHMKAMTHYNGVCLVEGVEPIDLCQRQCDRYESAAKARKEETE